MSEASLTDAARRALSATERCWWTKVHGGSYGRAGIPDFLVCLDGQFVALELKDPEKGRVSKLQERELALIERAGGVAAVCRSTDDVLAALEGRPKPLEAPANPSVGDSRHTPSPSLSRALRAVQPNIDDLPYP